MSKRFDVVRGERQDAVAERRRLVVFALLEAYVRQGYQRLHERGILTSGALEDESGLLEPAGGPEVVAEHDGVLRCELAVAVERAEIGDGELVFTGSRIGDGTGS